MVAMTMAAVTLAAAAAMATAMAEMAATVTAVAATTTKAVVTAAARVVVTAAARATVAMANADSHLQNYEHKKLGHTNKTDASTSIITCGDTLIGDLLHRNMLLIPFVIDPLGRFSPLLQNFLFGQHSAPQLRFPPSRPNATQMYSKLLQYPSLKGILLLANHNWSLHPKRRVYGHSYLAPTPSITTVQSLGHWLPWLSGRLRALRNEGLGFETSA